MSDLMALDTVRATELHQRMETAANDLDWDAQALMGPLAEAASLLGSPLPDVPGGARRVAGELRDSALDLQERTRMVLAGGPEMNEGLGALERIREHFTMIESRGNPDEADGLLSRRDLRWAVHSADSATAAAAGWLLDHDLFFDQVETAMHNDDYMDRVHQGEFAFDPDDRDGLMSRDDIDAFLDKTAAWSALVPHAATIDAAGSGAPDGSMSRADFEAFLSDYNLTADEANAVRQVLDDRAYHTAGGGIAWAACSTACRSYPSSAMSSTAPGRSTTRFTATGKRPRCSLWAWFPFRGCRRRVCGGPRRWWTWCWPRLARAV